MQVHVAFTVVHFDTKYGARDGVATNWLERLLEPVTSDKRTAAKAGIRVPIFLRRWARDDGMGATATGSCSSRLLLRDTS